jgi:hypothetical protein
MLALHRWGGWRGRADSELELSSFSPMKIVSPGKYPTDLALGLSRRFRGQQWLMVIGMQTMPEPDVRSAWGRR